MTRTRHSRAAAVTIGLLLLGACSTGDDADAEIVGVSETASTVAATVDGSLPASEPTTPSESTVASTVGASTPTTGPGVTAPVTTAEIDTATTVVDVGPTPATEPGETIPVRAAGGVLEDVAAELSVPGEVDEYEFDVLAGQAFAIEQLGGCTFVDGDSLWLEVDGAGVSTTERFDVQELEKSEDCDRVSRHDADETGTVRLRMRHRDDTATGPYSFRVVDVTDGSVVPLAYGDVVEPGSPTPGSGIIEGIARRDLYSVQVRSGEALAIEQLGGCIIEDGDDLWLDVVGAGIDTVANFREQDLEDSEDCEAVDRYEFDEDGLVILVMRHPDHEATGPYSFRLRDVTDAPTIPLSSGDVVGPDVPVAGAGRLDQVGENDVYSIEVSAGQTLVIEQLGGCVIEGDDDIWLRVGGAGLDSFSSFEAQDTRREDDCVDVDEFEVDEDGTVILRMLNSRDRVTGTYNFRVTTR